MNALADLVRRKQDALVSIPSPNIDNQLAALIKGGGNFIRNDTTGRVINLPQGQAQPRFTGSPVDVFGQGKGYLDPSSGMIRGVNPSGQQFRVQPAGMEAAKADAMKAELENRMKMAQLKELEMKAQGGMTPPEQLAREKFEWMKNGGNTTQKPLPVAALKLQQEELDAIGSASSLNKDLGAFTSMIEGGKLPLGLLTNLNYKAENLTGLSSPESRNYASFQANLERLRNESLRLNKGVQTEGDAVRAWNEILANINDEKLVAQRLKEVQKVNERAILLRKMQVDSIRSNYGKDPLDVSGREDVPAAYGEDSQWSDL